MTSPVVYRQAPRANSTCLRSDVQKGDGRRVSSTTEEKYTVKVSDTQCGAKGSLLWNYSELCLSGEESEHFVCGSDITVWEWVYSGCGECIVAVVAMLLCESQCTVAVVATLLWEIQYTVTVVAMLLRERDSTQWL
jgi:hypothetical protein